MNDSLLGLTIRAGLSLTISVTARSCGPDAPGELMVIVVLYVPTRKLEVLTERLSDPGVFPLVPSRANPSTEGPVAVKSSDGTLLDTAIVCDGGRTPPSW